MTISRNIWGGTCHVLRLLGGVVTDKVFYKILGGVWTILSWNFRGGMDHFWEI